MNSLTLFSICVNLSIRQHAINVHLQLDQLNAIWRTRKKKVVILVISSKPRDFYRPLMTVWTMNLSRRSFAHNVLILEQQTILRFCFLSLLNLLDQQAYTVFIVYYKHRNSTSFVFIWTNLHDETIKWVKREKTLSFLFLCIVLASTITTCSRNTPNPSECILNTINGLRQRLATGDLGDGVKTVALEPLGLDNIQFKRGPDFSATFNNLLVNGPSNFIVSKLKWVFLCLWFEVACFCSLTFFLLMMQFHNFFFDVFSKEFTFLTLQFFLLLLLFLEPISQIWNSTSPFSCQNWLSLVNTRWKCVYFCWISKVEVQLAEFWVSESFIYFAHFFFEFILLAC